MKSSIEEQIKYQQGLLQMYNENESIPSVVINQDILKQSINSLKILKELHSSKHAENYIVSMSLTEYKKYEEYKEFLAFQKQNLKKSEQPCQNPQSNQPSVTLSSSTIQAPDATSATTSSPLNPEAIQSAQIASKTLQTQTEVTPATT